MSSITYLKGKEPPKSRRSSMETLIFTRNEVESWKLPGFQRPIRVNGKVLGLAEDMKRDGGVVPGVLTLGRLGSDKTFYLVDGQHRVEGFKISELAECIADVRIIVFESMADMAEEFVNLNSRLVNMRPDDILRGLQESTPSLRRIISHCDFVSFGQVRRGDAKSALIGMSMLLRCWHMSHPEVPAQNAPPAATLASSLDVKEADQIIAFLNVARAAWGKDPENYRLWGALNLTITMWLWRRLVLDRERGVKRSIVLNADSFRKCLMSVSADAGYLDWLLGRSMCERDRSPCFMRLKAIFVKRLQQDGAGKVMIMTPAWASK